MLNTRGQQMTVVHRTMPSNRFLNHLIVSPWSILCECPILDLARLRFATRSPGRVLRFLSVCVPLPVHPRNQCGTPLPVFALSTLIETNSHAAIEVHAINANGWIVFDTQINVLADPKSEVAGLGEIALSQLVFFDLQAALEDFFRLGTADSDVHCNFLVTSDTESADCVACFACEEDQRKVMALEMFRPADGSWESALGELEANWRTVDGCLTTQLFQHFGGASESVTRFSNRDVQDKLLDAELPHRILGFVFPFRLWRCQH